MKRFTIKRKENWVAHVWADRFERSVGGCFHFYRGSDLVAGCADSAIDVHVFDESGVEIDVPIAQEVE